MKNVQFRNPEEAIETLRLATEAACLGIWDLDVDSGELHWSDRTKILFGISGPGPFTLADLSERLHPEDRERVLAAVSRAMDPSGPGDYDVEYRIIRPDQEERVIAAKGKAFFEEIAGERKATRALLSSGCPQLFGQAVTSASSQATRAGGLVSGAGPLPIVRLGVVDAHRKSRFLA